MNDPTRPESGLDAAQILPGDVITRHPDTQAPGEWTITNVRHPSVGHVRIRLDYQDQDGRDGCFVLRPGTGVTARKGSVSAWLGKCTADDMTHMIAFLAGYNRAALAAALANVQDQRDRKADQERRNAAEAVNA